MNKIFTLVRHCETAPKRKIKVRPPWFSFQKCFNSLYDKNSNIENNVIMFFDGNHDEDNSHVKFELEPKKEMINFHQYIGGTDAASLKYVLAHVGMNTFKAEDDDIIYIVEDDYLHRPGWQNVLAEGLWGINVDYATLYDHPDKYFLPMYNNLMAKILFTDTVHWRTTPSTCNTYAAKYSTLKKHLDIHLHFCDPNITHDGYDHTKFTELWKNGSNLISSVPGYSTHCETDFISPAFDWSTL
ncbi:hypothetical protein [Microcystis phage Mel-JY01]